MTENTRFITGEEQFAEAMKEMNIPSVDVGEGLDYVTDFFSNHPLTDDNRLSYWIIMAVSAYHAGKSKAE